MKKLNEMPEIMAVAKFDGRGKCVFAFSGLRSLAALWCLQNTKGKTKSYLYDLETGKVERVYTYQGPKKAEDDLFIKEI